MSDSKEHHGPFSDMYATYREAATAFTDCAQECKTLRAENEQLKAALAEEFERGRAVGRCEGKGGHQGVTMAGTAPWECVFCGYTGSSK